MLMVKEKHLLFTQEKPNKQAQVFVHTEKTANIKLLLEICQCFLTKLLFLVIWFAEVFEMTVELAKEWNLARFDRLDFVNNAFDIFDFKTILERLIRSYFSLQLAVSIRPLVLLFDWQFLVDWRLIHSFAVPGHEVDRDNKYCAVEATNISDESHKSVGLSFVCSLYIWKLKVDIQLR